MKDWSSFRLLFLHPLPPFLFNRFQGRRNQRTSKVQGKDDTYLLASLCWEAATEMLRKMTNTGRSKKKNDKTELSTGILHRKRSWHKKWLRKNFWHQVMVQCRSCVPVAMPFWRHWFRHSTYCLFVSATFFGQHQQIMAGQYSSGSTPGPWWYVRLVWSHPTNCTMHFGPPLESFIPISNENGFIVPPPNDLAVRMCGDAKWPTYEKWWKNITRSLGVVGVSTTNGLHWLQEGCAEARWVFHPALHG